MTEYDTAIKLLVLLSRIHSYIYPWANNNKKYKNNKNDAIIISNQIYDNISVLYY